MVQICHSSSFSIPYRLYGYMLDYPVFVWLCWQLEHEKSIVTTLMINLYCFSSGYSVLHVAQISGDNPTSQIIVQVGILIGSVFCQCSAAIYAKDFAQRVSMHISRTVLFFDEKITGYVWGQSYILIYIFMVDCILVAICMYIYIAIIKAV